MPRPEVQKRGNPFTPEPAGIGKSNLKKGREYASPLRTPLRNAVRASIVEGRKTPFSSTPGTPLNDDEDERLKHRAALVNNRKHMKKTLLSPALNTTPKANPPSSLAKIKNITLRVGNSPLTPTAIQSNAAKLAAPQAAPKLTVEQRNKMFEEWMKIAADNKINAKNSWNVALIDYFSELTFLREGDSINFQKASCTLDGCVKIYATRVDSVVDETGKLLNGLSEGHGKKGRWATLNDPEAVNEGVEGDEQDSMKKIKSSKRPHRQVDTLERSFESLDVKNFQLEFALDPLFRKTCAEFDESGSKGCLTGSLPLSPSGCLMLDNSETFTVEGEEACLESGREPSGQMDFSNLFVEHGKSVASLVDKTILPSLVDFSFTRDGGDYKLSRQITETLEKLANIPPLAAGETTLDGVSDDDDGDDIEVNFEDQIIDSPLNEEMVPLNDDYGDFEFGGLDNETAPTGEITSPLHIPVNSIRPSNLLTTTTTTTEEVAGEEFEQNGMSSSFLAYFDSKLQRNWAGPEHWKIQRSHFRRAPIAMTVEKSKPAKKEFSLDFYAPSVDITAIFVKTNPATITLSRSALDDRNAKDNLLPEDLQFSSVELLRLFTNPSWTIGRKRKTISTRKTIQAPTLPEGHDLANTRPDLALEEIDASYWADPQNLDPNPAHPTVDAERVPLDDDFGGDGYDYPDEPPLPTALAIDDAASAFDHPKVSFGESLVPTFRSTNAVPLDFARRAKKVDVQELKRVLWAELESISFQKKRGPKAGNVEPPTSTFASLIDGLTRSSLPKEMLPEVSVPYCFICLLHLANEHNLELRESPETSDLLVVNPGAPLVSQ